MNKMLLFALAVILGLLTTIYPQSIARPRADTCESSSAKLDMIRNIFASEKNSKKLILISRLGENEKSSRLHSRRVHTITRYLVDMGVAEGQIVTAQSSRIRGLGTVEVYISGELTERIYANTASGIPVGRCEDEIADRDRYQRQ